MPGMLRHSVRTLGLLLLVIQSSIVVQPAAAAARVANSDCRYRVAATPDDSLHPWGLAAVGANDIWEFGEATQDNGASYLPSRGRHWDGSTWTTVPMPGIGIYFGGAAVSTTDVWAVGQQGFAHWDGVTWTLAHGPFTGHPLPMTASATGPNDVWAVGNRITSQGPNGQGDLYHFDGSTWSVVPVAQPSSGSILLNGVKALAPNDVWVVGELDPGSGSQSAVVRHWNGSTWSDVPSFTDSAHTVRLDAIDGASGDLWMTGVEFGATVADLGLVEHWNGVAISRVATNLQFEAWSVSRRSATDAWVAGQWYDGTSQVRAAHWDGSAWAPVALADGASDNGVVPGLAAIGPGTAWISADGSGTGPPWGPGHTEYFSCQPPLQSVAAVEGADGGVFAQALGSGAWQSLGGRIIGSPTVVSAPQPSGVDVRFYLATWADHDVWVRIAGVGWVRLTSAPVSCLEEPAAAVIAHALDVACRGADGALWHTRADLTGGRPRSTAWQSLGGGLAGAPAIGDVGGNLSFFATGNDGAIWTRSLGADWTRTPWVCIGHPALAADGGTSRFACHGADGALWTADNSGSGWSAARSLGGILVGGVGITAKDGVVSYFVEGADAALWTTTVTAGSQAPWTGAGGRLVGGAAAGTG